MPKTVKMAILFRGAKQPKTNSKPAIPSAKKTTRQTTQQTTRSIPKTFPFELPPGLQLTPLEAHILTFLNHTPGLDYEQWPKSVKVARIVEKLRQQKYVRRKYEPTRYFLTREGTGIVAWLNRLREHTETSPN